MRPARLTDTSRALQKGKHVRVLSPASPAYTHIPNKTWSCFSKIPKNKNGPNSSPPPSQPSINTPCRDWSIACIAPSVRATNLRAPPSPILTPTPLQGLFDFFYPSSPPEISKGEFASDSECKVEPLLLKSQTIVSPACSLLVPWCKWVEGRKKWEGVALKLGSQR